MKNLPSGCMIPLVRLYDGRGGGCRSSSSGRGCCGRCRGWLTPDVPSLVGALVYRERWRWCGMGMMETHVESCRRCKLQGQSSSCRHDSRVIVMLTHCVFLWHRVQQQQLRTTVATEQSTKDVTHTLTNIAHGIQYKNYTRIKPIFTKNV